MNKDALQRAQKHVVKLQDDNKNLQKKIQDLMLDIGGNTDSLDKSDVTNFYF